MRSKWWSRRSPFHTHRRSWIFDAFMAITDPQANIGSQHRRTVERENALRRVLLALDDWLLLNLNRVLALGNSNSPSSAVRRPHGGVTEAHAPHGDPSGAYPEEGRCDQPDSTSHSGVDVGYLVMAMGVLSVHPSSLCSSAALVPRRPRDPPRSTRRCRTAWGDSRGLLRGASPRWAETYVIWVWSNGSRGWH